MATPSLKEKLANWEMMSSNLKAQLADIPHLTADQAALEHLVAEGQALAAQQGIHLASLRETNRQRFDLEKRGDELQDRLAGALRCQFGPKSPKLHEFGVKPRASRHRKPLTAEQKKQVAIELLKKRLSELESAPAGPAASSAA
jgi:chromosome segregation ATPase